MLVILWTSSLCLTTMIGCGIFFVDDLDIHLLPRCLRSSVFNDGQGLPLPSVTLKPAFSSLSQNKSSSEFCRRWGMSLRMLKFDRDNIVTRHSSNRKTNQRSGRQEPVDRYYMAEDNGPGRNRCQQHDVT
jgi:hypothetical protein